MPPTADAVQPSLAPEDLDIGLPSANNEHAIAAAVSKTDDVAGGPANKWAVDDKMVRVESKSRSQSKHMSSMKMAMNLVRNGRVVKYGVSFPIIFVVSVAIGFSYGYAYFVMDKGVEWLPGDLTGFNEWTSTTRTHLTQDPQVLLDDLVNVNTIGVDTSVSVNFLVKYGTANEVNIESTKATFNPQWLDANYIMQNGYTIAGQMAGAFEGYGVWPCAKALLTKPILSAVCPDPVNGWFGIHLYNNMVATTSQKASTYLAPDYSPLALMSARVWPADAPVPTSDGIIVKGYKEGTYTERNHYLLKLEQGVLALAKVMPCDRTTQTNALECDQLEENDFFVRNYHTRDFVPASKLDKLKVYGPAHALGNYVAADKVYVQLPATAIMMFSTGYSATSRFSTTFAFRLTIKNGGLTFEASIPQVASFSQAVGNGFATATAQMVIVVWIVYNALSHCKASEMIQDKEDQIYGFRNSITFGIIARRLGSYKIVFIQLCLYHFLNVGTYMTAVYNETQKITDTIAFASEGFLLVIVTTMLLDQIIFFERYSSMRETMTVITSSLLYLLLLYIQQTFMLKSKQVQVTELKKCAQANSCRVMLGTEYYYIGLAIVLLLPVVLVNGPVNRWITKVNPGPPADPVTEDQLTSFEKRCVGIDARLEFGDYKRDKATPISVIHAAGFTYVGDYLVRIKDYYMVTYARHAPQRLVEMCGMTLTVFPINENGEVMAGQHALLGAIYKKFRMPATKMSNKYTPLR